MKLERIRNAGAVIRTDPAGVRRVPGLNCGNQYSIQNPSEWCRLLDSATHTQGQAGIPGGDEYTNGPRRLEWVSEGPPNCRQIVRLDEAGIRGRQDTGGGELLTRTGANFVNHHTLCTFWANIP